MRKFDGGVFGCVCVCVRACIYAVRVKTPTHSNQQTIIHSDPKACTSLNHHRNTSESNISQILRTYSFRLNRTSKDTLLSIHWPEEPEGQFHTQTKRRRNIREFVSRDSTGGITEPRLAPITLVVEMIFQFRLRGGRRRFGSAIRRHTRVAPIDRWERERAREENACRGVMIDSSRARNRFIQVVCTILHTHTHACSCGRTCAVCE